MIFKLEMTMLELGEGHLLRRKIKPNFPPSTVFGYFSQLANLSRNTSKVTSVNRTDGHANTPEKGRKMLIKAECENFSNGSFLP